MSARKVLVVFGTRPEAIKLAPVVRAIVATPGLACVTCLTGQHREMAGQVVEFFGLEIHHDLDIMEPNQTLTGVTVNTLRKLSAVLQAEQPDWVVVQGDTTTSFAAALEAFHQKIPVAHVEAGLRTYDKHSPFPEEMNRQLTARLADLHFAPTEVARKNLLAERIDAADIVMTGNTVADALLLALERLAQPEVEVRVKASLPALRSDRRLVLVTGHRRESFGPPFREFCSALRTLAETEPVQIVFPVHLNPNVRAPVAEILSGAPNVHLLDPVPYPQLVWLMREAHFIVTDSGGIQEEAASMGKPVLVTRTTTERMESVDAGVSRLVGTSGEAISSGARELLHDAAAYARMARRVDLYGDGRASERIAKALIDRGSRDERRGIVTP